MTKRPDPETEPTTNVHSAAPAPDRALEQIEPSEVRDVANEIREEGLAHVPLGT